MLLGLDNSNNLGELLDPVSYKSPDFENFEMFSKYLDDILLNNKPVKIYGDYDTDGLTCILIWKDYFLSKGFTNFDIFKYRNRTHKIDPQLPGEVTKGKYEYIIISDTGTDDMAIINRLSKLGYKLIIVDHHQTPLNYDDYPDTVVVINAVIENRLNSFLNEKYTLMCSAGALTYMLLDKYEGSEIDSQHLVCYALVSLYADCMSMMSETNRGIYYRTNMAEIPRVFSAMMTRTQQFCRRTISFTIAPKINACFRTERFDLLNKYFLDNNDISYDELIYLENLISENHEKARVLTDKVSDIIGYEIYNNFIVANLNTVNDEINVRDNKLYNFTGVVANKLSSRFGKPCVVTCNFGRNITGSFRDGYSRDFLHLFQTFCNAGGHNSAFGFKISIFDFLDFKKYIKILDERYTSGAIENQPITIKGEDPILSMDYIRRLAYYNEFSGGNIPDINISITYDGVEVTEGRSFRGTYSYRWKGYIVSSPRRLLKGQSFLCKPTVSSSIKLYV